MKGTKKMSKRALLKTWKNAFKFVEYDIVPGPGQIPSLVFWTDCELCGSLLNCNGINQECHYSRQRVYTHVIPVAWAAITFFLAFLSRPSSPQLFERRKKLVPTASLYFFIYFFFFKLCIPSDSRGIAPNLNLCDTRIWGLAITDGHQGTAALTKVEHML